jgi:hypothetical protein
MTREGGERGRREEEGEEEGEMGRYEWDTFSPGLTPHTETNASHEKETSNSVYACRVGSNFAPLRWMMP